MSRYKENKTCSMCFVNVFFFKKKKQVQNSSNEFLGNKNNK